LEERPGWLAVPVLLFLGSRRSEENKKRLPVSEIRDALKQIRITGVLTREAFRKCPIAKSAPYSFAVLGRILEALHVAVYSGRAGFRLTNADKATNLLAILLSLAEAQ
jgi:hypothetical protein